MANSNANFTPDLEQFTGIQPFRYWCQHVLPISYDDSLSYYELLCKLVEHMNTFIDDVDGLFTDVTSLRNAYIQLQNYVNNYFDNLDVTQEIYNKLDEMVMDGTLTNLIRPIVAAVSQPRIVDSVDDMINITYTYVLRSNGHIYQYITNKWTDTGLVYVADATGFLGLRNMIAYDLNNLNQTGIYFHGTSDPNASNTPNDTSFRAGNFLCIVYYQSDYRFYQMFYTFSDNNLYIRHKKGSTWTEWEAVYLIGGSLPYNNLNNIVNSGTFYHISTADAAINTPDDRVYANSAFMICCYYSSQNHHYQIFYSHSKDNSMYVRHQIADAWSTWASINVTADGLPFRNLNSIVSSGSYFHLSTDDAALNTPDDSVYGTGAFMITCSYVNNNHNYQVFYSHSKDNAMYIRHQIAGTWTDWSVINVTSESLPFRNLNNIVSTGSYFHKSTDEAALNTPNDSVYRTAAFMVTTNYSNNVHQYQIFYSHGKDNSSYIRHKLDADNWSDWATINVTAGVLPFRDLNNIISSGSYFHSSSDEEALNTPNDAYRTSVFMVTCNYGATTYKNYQVFYGYGSDNAMFIRHQQGSSWTAWSGIQVCGELPFRDLDNIVTSGKYVHRMSGTAAAHTPGNNQYANADFIVDSAFIDYEHNIQLFFGLNDNYIWFRSRVSQSQGWTLWKRLAFANEIASSNVSSTLYETIPSDSDVPSKPDETIPSDSDGTQTGTIVDVDSGMGNTED